MKNNNQFSHASFGVKMKSKVILTTMILQMKNSFQRSMFRFCLIANPIANTILIYYMFQNSGKENFISYVIMGAGLMGLWSCICFSSAGDINRERWSGTLSIIYTAPADFRLIIWGKILGNTVLALFTLFISFITAKVLFHADLSLGHLGYFIISMSAAIVCFMTISIVIAYILTLSRKTTLYMNCIEIPVTLLSGFVFPIDLLPKWMLPISNCLSPTWAVKLIRMSIEGNINRYEYWRTFLVLVILNIIYLFGISILYKVIDHQVRIHATLEVS